MILLHQAQLELLQDYLLLIRKVILIAGGYDKHIPFEPLAEEGYPYIKELILLGDTKYKIKASF